MRLRLFSKDRQFDRAQVGKAGSSTACAADGAELARWLLCVCHAGISLREAGWCFGAPLAAEIEVVGHSIVHSRAGQTASRIKLAERRYALHLRREHALGCRGLGVSERVLVRLLRHWDSDGVAKLLIEAVEEAGAEAECAVQNGSWTALGAREMIEHAVRTRITPAEPILKNAAGPALLS